MIAEYNHWYKCQKGQMPEDFENIDFETIGFAVKRKEGLLISGYDGRLDLCQRTVNEPIGPSYFVTKGVTLKARAWMLPAPYVEQ